MSKVGNTVNFIGRLTKDIELKMVGDSYVANFCLARNRDYAKDKEHPESDFVDCVAWGKTAEILNKYFSKGGRVGVSGSLQTRVYDSSNGYKVKVTEVFVEQIEFIDKKDSKSESVSPVSDEQSDKSSTHKSEPKNNSYSNEDELPF